MGGETPHVSVGGKSPSPHTEAVWEVRPPCIGGLAGTWRWGGEISGSTSLHRLCRHRVPRRHVPHLDAPRGGAEAPLVLALLAQPRLPEGPWGCVQRVLGSSQPRPMGSPPRSGRRLPARHGAPFRLDVADSRQKHIAGAGRDDRAGCKGSRQGLSRQRGSGREPGSVGQDVQTVDWDLKTFRALFRFNRFLVLEHYAKVEMNMC